MSAVWISAGRSGLVWTHTQRVPSSESDQAPLRPPGAEAVMTEPDSTLTRNRPVEVPSPLGQKTYRPFADQMGTEKFRSTSSRSTRGVPPSEAIRYSLSCSVLLVGVAFEANAMVRPSGDQRGDVSLPPFSWRRRRSPVVTSTIQTSLRQPSLAVGFGRVSKAICRESGDQSGLATVNSPAVSRRVSALSISCSHRCVIRCSPSTTSASPSFSRRSSSSSGSGSRAVNSRAEPSGAKENDRTDSSCSVTCQASPPSAYRKCTCVFASASSPRAARNAMIPPSGDHAGAVAFCGPRVSCRFPVPSTRTRQRWVTAARSSASMSRVRSV